jgi:two-component sensor histidine kinase
MFNKADPQQQQNGKRYLPPELAIDLEADNAILRAALAKSIGANEQRELVTQELKHRIGNLLAVVHAIARQTFGPADAASMVNFSARLHALAEAQKLLIDAETSPASLASVVAAALAAHCPDPERATINGPELAINGRRAHALTLALHELATNAAKYGALSAEDGGIEIVWTVSDDQLDLLWREHGGPPVSAPTRRGFGSMLITRNLGAAFSGKADLQFPPAGLTCRLIAPARAHTGDAL